MPTLNKLEYLDETKQQIKTALNTNFNSQIQDTDTFRSYVSKIKDIYTNWHKVTGEDTALTLSPTKKGLMALDLKGNTSQEGTPTPETPQDIHVVSGDNSIVVCGKNLVFSKIANENISSSGLLLIDNSFDMHIARVTQGETYTITSNDINNGFVGGFFYDLPKHNMFTYNNQRVVTNSWTFTAPITGYVVFRSQAGYEYAQLEKGNQATTYEEYKSASYPITLPEGMFLGWIGTYQDNIFKNTPNTTDYNSNLEDNVWYVKKEIGKVVLDGSEEWIVGSTGTANWFYQVQTTLENKSNGSELSNYYKYAGGIGGTTTNNGVFVTGNGLVRIRYGEEDTISNYKNWLSTHNLEVYCVSTPTYTEITDSTLLSQLETLRTATSYDNQTNISQTNDDLPFIISASALMKGGN